ncbi:hypothetical protein H4R35_003694 [Dimargaris xerosporica]|nr:hypothetical protein H4R35_003694 [Dimargaris xerosporica]
MNTTQTTAASQKPTLNGVRLKARKRVNKANAKFDPEAFREQVVTIIEDIDASKDKFEQVLNNLDVAGNTLDYRRYGETLFEILIAGGIVAPGGIIEAEDDVELTFNIFTVSEGTIDNIKPYVDVFNRLIRRYKYLMPRLETTIRNLLQNVNKWPAADVNKLATLVGLLVSTQLVPLSVLTALLNEHLVKEGMSLVCLTLVLRVCLAEQGIDQLSRHLKKNKLDTKLLEFFPPNKQDEESFARHFEVEDLKPIVKFRVANRQNALMDELVSTAKEMIQEEKPAEEVAGHLNRMIKENHWAETDVIGLIWDAVMGAVDWSTRPEILEAQTLRQVKDWSMVLAAFCTQPKTEVTLLGHIQIYCYENAKLMKLFTRIVQIMYNEDVLSDNAILFWYAKGAKPQGKAIFIKQMAPFVDFLENATSEDEDDDEA